MSSRCTCPPRSRRRRFTWRRSAPGRLCCHWCTTWGRATLISFFATPVRAGSRRPTSGTERIISGVLTACLRSRQWRGSSSSVARATARELDAIRAAGRSALRCLHDRHRPMLRRSRASSASASRRTSDRPASCWSTSFRSGPPEAPNRRSLRLGCRALVRPHGALYGHAQRSRHAVSRSERTRMAAAAGQPRFASSDPRRCAISSRAVAQGEILTRGPELFMGYTDCTTR